MKQYVHPMYRVCKLYKEIIDYNTVAALNLSKVWVHNYIDVIRRPLTSTGIICKEYNIKVADKWYKHTPETVTDNENEHETWTIQLSSGTFQLMPIRKSNPTGQTSLPYPWSKMKCWRSACWLIWLYPLNKIHLSKCLKSYQSMRSKYQQCGTFLPVAIWALGLVKKGLGKWLEKNPWEHQYWGTPEDQSSGYYPVNRVSFDLPRLKRLC